MEIKSELYGKLIPLTVRYKSELLSVRVTENVCVWWNAQEIWQVTWWDGIKNDVICRKTRVKNDDTVINNEWNFFDKWWIPAWKVEQRLKKKKFDWMDVLQECDWNCQWVCLYLNWEWERERVREAYNIF